jgi:hypothetical protein
LQIFLPQGWLQQKMFWLLEFIHPTTSVGCIYELTTKQHILKF